MPQGVAQPQTAPQPPQDLDAEDVAWACGLFEGEGSLSVRAGDKVSLSLSTTDLDVLERFRAIIGAGSLSSQAPGRNGRNKRLWRVVVHEASDIFRIVALFYDRLGDRRRQRADHVLAILEQRIAEATFERSCPNCGGVFRPPFTSNAKATIYCSRRCERRHRVRQRYGPAHISGQTGLEL